jgi:acyl carrier protein
MKNALRSIVENYGKLSKPMTLITDDSDLFAAGMDSLAMVNVMLAIEESFGIEFRDDLLNRASFSSISALEHAVRSSHIIVS